MTDAPNPDDCEITIIGPGYGESICIHIGSGRWIIVDSCYSRNDASPAALTYLNEIGVDYASQVDLIVCTHWHDDHTRGLTETFRACASAKVCIGRVMTSAEFLQHSIAWNAPPLPTMGSRVSEMLSLIRELKTCRHRLIHASQGSILLLVSGSSLAHGASFQLTAISPSSLAETDFLHRIVDNSPSVRETKRTCPDLQPNDASVALWLELGATRLLLSADLENSASPYKGWKAFLNATDCPLGKAAIVKVAHHGSQNGYDSEVWATRIEENAYAVVTPWMKASQLPTKADVDRLRASTPNSFITANMDFPTRARRSAAVDKQMKEMRVAVRPLRTGYGAVRLRCNLSSSNPQWSLKKLGSAHAL